MPTGAVQLGVLELVVKQHSAENSASVGGGLLCEASIQATVTSVPLATTRGEEAGGSGGLPLEILAGMSGGKLLAGHCVASMSLFAPLELSASTIQAVSLESIATS